MGPLKHHLRSEGPLERALEVGFFSGQFFLFPFLFTLLKADGILGLPEIVFFDRQVFLFLFKNNIIVSVDGFVFLWII